MDSTGVGSESLIFTLAVRRGGGRIFEYISSVEEDMLQFGMYALF